MAHNFRTMSRGWSNVGCWTGYGLSSVLLLVTSCVSCVEMKKSGEHNIVHVQPYLPHCDTTHEETLFAAHKHSKQVRFQKKNLTVERLPGYDHCIQKENRIADTINGYNYN